MAETEVSKPSEKSLARSRDIFSVMRNEKDRVFERFESGWLRWPTLFARDGDTTAVPDLDVRENANAAVVEADLPGVDEMDVAVRFSNGLLTVGRKRREGR